MVGRRIILITGSVVLAGCAADSPQPTAFEVRAPLFAQSVAKTDNIGTHLSGDEEFPPRETLAQGQAMFRIADDGQSIDYKLIASNIDNAFMAHIHMGPPKANSGIVVWLFPSTVPNVTGPLGAGRHDGVLAEGTIRATDLVGALAGHPLADLIAVIRSGGTYVNVHTNDGVAPTNTGPGDFPGGEIRGQLVHGSVQP